MAGRLCSLAWMRWAGDVKERIAEAVHKLVKAVSRPQCRTSPRQPLNAHPDFYALWGSGCKVWRRPTHEGRLRAVRGRVVSVAAA